jgi:hypothetical protein
MQLHGISFDVANVPVLDEGFAPMAKFVKEFLKEAREPLAIAVERNNG